MVQAPVFVLISTFVLMRRLFALPVLARQSKAQTTMFVLIVNLKLKYVFNARFFMLCKNFDFFISLFFELLLQLVQS